MNDKELILKPCPFCGGKPVKGMFSIWCGDCRIQTESDVTTSEKELIKAWNTRVTGCPHYRQGYCMKHEETVK